MEMDENKLWDDINKFERRAYKLEEKMILARY